MPPIRPELLDELLEDYHKPEDLLGQDGLLRQLTKALVERARRRVDAPPRLREARLIGRQLRQLPQRHGSKDDARIARSSPG